MSDNGNKKTKYGNEAININSNILSHASFNDKIDFKSDFSSVMDKGTIKTFASIAIDTTIGGFAGAIGGFGKVLVDDLTQKTDSEDKTTSNEDNEVKKDDK